MKKINYAALFFLFFLFSSSPAVLGFQSTGLIVSILFSCYFILLSLIFFRVGENLLKICLLFSPIVFYLLLVFVLNNGADSEMLRRVSTILFSVLGGYGLVKFSLIYFPEWKINHYLRLLFFVALIHSIILLLQYLSPDIRYIIYGLTGFQSENLRMAGLYLAAGDGVSLNITLLLMPFLAAYFTKYKPSSLVFFLFGIAFILITTLSGRTGAFLTPFILVFSYLVSSNSIHNLIKKIFFLILFFVMFFVFVFYILFPVLIDLALDTSKGFNDPIVRLLQPVRTYVLDGSANISSLDALTDRMLILPDSFAHLFFGNGEFGREGLVYVSSDIGFVRMIFGMGIVGVLLLLLPFTYAVIKAYKHDKNYGFILLIVFFFGVLANFKIVYLPTVIFNNVFFFLYFLFFNIKADK